jgi:predicted Zn-dependent peptidase
LHRNPAGNLEDVDRITRDDILRFHEKYYRPDRTVLVVVGDISPDQALAAVGRAFGSWTPLGVAATPRPPIPPRPREPRSSSIPGSLPVRSAFPGRRRRPEASPLPRPAGDPAASTRPRRQGEAAPRR